MRKIGLTACAVLLAAGIAVAFSCWSWAYLKVDSSGCLECHALGVFGAGDGSIHGSHSNCADCHDGTPGAGNVFTSACLACHPASDSALCDLVNFHEGSVSYTPSGAACLDCHSTCGGSTTTTTTPQPSGVIRHPHPVRRRLRPAGAPLRTGNRCRAQSGSGVDLKDHLRSSHAASECGHPRCGNRPYSHSPRLV